MSTTTTTTTTNGGRRDALFSSLASVLDRDESYFDDDHEGESDRGFLDPILPADLYELAAREPTPLSLANMYRYASTDNPEQRLRNARFLYRELPVRIAQRAVDLFTLPHGLSKTDSVRGVVRVYVSHLRRLLASPEPSNAAEEKAFTELLESLVLDRTSIPVAVASAVSNLKDHRREALDDRRLREMEEALYRFFAARVGLRFLVEHHVMSSPDRPSRAGRALLGEDVDYDNDETDFLGCIRRDCDPVAEARAVADSVSRMCREELGDAPEIEIVAPRRTDGRQRRRRRSFTYVPHHLRYMLAELLRNACRATVTHHLDSGAVPPPVRVVVVDGAEDVTIKIADRGGGLPRSDVDRVWTFATVRCANNKEKRTKNAKNNNHNQESGAAAASFFKDGFTGTAIRGFGLPLSRIYARYFGGELTLKTMEGYGVDAYLHLPMLGEACENLPDTVRRSPGNLASVSSSSKEEEEQNGGAGVTETNGEHRRVETSTPHYDHDGSADGGLTNLTRVFPAAMSNRALELLSRRAL